MSFFSFKTKPKNKVRNKSNKIIDKIVLPLINGVYNKAKQRANGKVEREGVISWYKDGLLHHNNQAAIIWEDGSYQWYHNGVIHRENGPAVESNGNKYWYENGNRHRLEGPAVEFTNGMKEWWIEGIQVTQEEFEDYLKEINFNTDKSFK